MTRRTLELTRERGEGRAEAFTGFTEDADDARSMEALPTVVEEVTDPAEIARFHRDRERHRLNDEVFRRNMALIYGELRGKVIVVAGQELHAAETPESAWAWARGKHPEDTAPLVRYIPEVKAWRVYATLG